MKMNTDYEHRAYDSLSGKVRSIRTLTRRKSGFKMFVVSNKL